MPKVQSTRSFRIAPTESISYMPRMFGGHGAIASEHYLSAMAGIEILKSGGNAIDAAVAAVLVEGLVNPQMHTIGGEIPMLIAGPGIDGIVCINGNMVAPRRATPEAFEALGHSKIPPTGVLAAGVPGAMGALLEALLRYGRLSFADVMAPARQLANDGFPVHSGLLRQHGFGIQDNVERFRSEWHGSAALYLPDGRVPQEGELLRNPALAAMFDYMAAEEKWAGGSRENGVRAAFDAFYKGDIAREIATFVAERGGLLDREDLQRFSVPIESPYSVEFDGVQLFKCGPWTQGPAVLQTLTILKNFDLRALGHNSVAYIHTVVEAMKLAFADREQFYGDPDFADVPMSALLSDAYGRVRSELISERADVAIRPGAPLTNGALLPAEQRLGGASWGPGTVHVDASDRDGYVAAFTPSGAWIKSSEVIPALGFPLGVRLSNCQLAPRHHPNVVAPYKRPRTTISPSIAVKNGKPWIAFGSMGGDQQDQWQLQFFLNRAVFDMPLRAAIDAPKFSSEHFPGLFHPHDFFLNRLRIEETVGQNVLDGLAQLGHDVDPGPAWSEGFLCAVERNPATGVFEAGSDQRGTKSEVFPALALAF